MNTENNNKIDLKKIQAEYKRYTESAIKKEFDKRQEANDLIWKMEHKNGLSDESKVKAKSGYIFNAIIGKHADAMDNYPEANILPREASDIKEAEKLTKIIPCVLDLCDFKKVYSDNWYAKLKNGTACYGIFWNSEKLNGLGDIEIKKIDLMSLAFEPGISDLEESKYLFYTYRMSKESFVHKYKNTEGIEFCTSLDAHYKNTDTDFVTEKVKIIDCYYKKSVGGTYVLHLLKFSGDKILFSSEKEYPDGFYEHASYPFVLDVLYPYEDSPLGFGVIDVLYHTQTQIDKLDEMILKNAVLSGKKRIMASKSMGLNKDEFLDIENDYIEFEGNINENNFKEFSHSPIPSQVVNYREAKINEAKEVIGNRDFQQGGTSGGVTAASAITVLQSAGDKLTRDYVGASYRAYKKIVLLVIELMRQFYDVERNFRITGIQSVPEFASYSNEGIKLQSMGEMKSIDGDEAYTFESALRKPEFDVVLSVQKENPYTKQMQNQTILQLFQAGLFNPQNIQSSLIALEALQFEGKEAIIEKLTNLNANMQSVQGATIPQSPFGASSLYTKEP